MTNQRVHVVINPASAGGKTQTLVPMIWKEVDKLFNNSCKLHVTGSPGEATSIALRAIQGGATLIVAVGGDGTIQEVVNGFFSNGTLLNPHCELGVINSGTGHGFAQSLGLPQNPVDQIALIARGKSRLIDVGKVSLKGPGADITERYFVNECQLGLGGAVVQKVQTNHKRLGGTLGFGLGTIESVFQYKNQWMTMCCDGQCDMTERFTGIVIANGAFTGGGMNLAPGARVDDGEFNVLSMRNLSVLERLRNFPRIYSGNHIRSRSFGYQTAKTVTVNSSDAVLVEADGELLGTTPCTIQIKPSLIKVRSVLMEAL